MFWAFLDHLIWAIFHSGTFGTYDWKKSSKISSSKKVRFQGWLKLAYFLILNLHVFQGCYGQKPKKLEIRKYANLSQPWNLTFLEIEIFQLFFQSYVPKVPEWKIAHIEWSKNVQNIRKSPKNKGFRGTYCIPPFWEHPVDKDTNRCLDI